jgi:vacuolar-type H+-ATPase subunit H
MESKVKLEEEILNVEKKIKEIRDYYASQREEEVKKTRQRIAQMNTEWENKLKELENQLLSEGRKEIEKEVAALLKQGKEQVKAVKKTKVSERLVKKALQRFLKEVA